VHGSAIASGGSVGGRHAVDAKPAWRASFGGIDMPSQVLAAETRASLPGNDVLSGVMHHLDELAESEEEDNDALASRLAHTIRRGGVSMNSFWR